MPKIYHRLNMGSKTRLSSYCSKRDDNTVKINTRLARPIVKNDLRGEASQSDETFY